MTPRTVLVRVDESEGAGWILRMACLAAGDGGRVVVLALTEVHPALPLLDLPAHYDEPALRAIHWAWQVVAALWTEEEAIRIEIETRVRRTHSAARTILEEAERTSVDTIFLALKQPRLSWLPLRLGGTIRTVMRRSPCPVVVGRFPPVSLSPSDVLAEAQRVLHRDAS